MAKTYRVFEYDSESGQATPVENVILNKGDVVLVSGSLQEAGAKLEPTKPDSENKGDRTAK